LYRRSQGRYRRSIIYIVAQKNISAFAEDPGKSEVVEIKNCTPLPAYANKKSAVQILKPSPKPSANKTGRHPSH
ncbi:hypothetical protein, partial [Planococcus sp. CAU13]|uniref:hypothetical protein n=1 Tax=Planococcus sp. CAU13 TaxID=1541197 RepID=UPI00052FFA8C